MKTCSTALGVGERDGLFGDGFCVVEGWFVGCRGAWYGRVRRESGWEECARAGAGAVADAGAGSAAGAGAALDSGAGATEALPRARARYAVAPVLLAPRIFYMLHIIDIVIMFCYDAKKNEFNLDAGSLRGPWTLWGIFVVQSKEIWKLKKQRWIVVLLESNQMRKMIKISNL